MTENVQCLFLGDYNDNLRTALAHEFHYIGHILLFPENYILTSNTIVKQIQESISSSEFVIINIGSNNNNIIFGMGMAAALNKKIILITNKKSLIPSIFMSYPYFSFRNNKISVEHLAKSITRLIQVESEPKNKTFTTSDFDRSIKKGRIFSTKKTKTISISPTKFKKDTNSKKKLTEKGFLNEISNLFTSHGCDVVRNEKLDDFEADLVIFMNPELQNLLGIRPSIILGEIKLSKLQKSTILDFVERLQKLEIPTGIIFTEQKASDDIEKLIWNISYKKKLSIILINKNILQVLNDKDQFKKFFSHNLIKKYLVPSRGM